MIVDKTTLPVDQIGVLRASWEILRVALLNEAPHLLEVGKWRVRILDNLRWVFSVCPRLDATMSVIVDARHEKLWSISMGEIVSVDDLHGRRWSSDLIGHLRPVLGLLIENLEDRARGHAELAALLRGHTAGDS